MDMENNSWSGLMFSFKAITCKSCLILLYFGKPSFQLCINSNFWQFLNLKKLIVVNYIFFWTNKALTKTLFKSVNYLRRLQRHRDHGAEINMELTEVEVNRGMLIKLNYKLSIFFRRYFFLTKAYCWGNTLGLQGGKT